MKSFFRGVVPRLCFFFIVMFYVKYISDTVKNNNNKKNCRELLTDCETGLYRVQALSPHWVSWLAGQVELI